MSRIIIQVVGRPNGISKNQEIWFGLLYNVIGDILKSSVYEHDPSVKVSYYETPCTGYGYYMNLMNYVIITDTKIPIPYGLKYMGEYMIEELYSWVIETATAVKLSPETHDNIKYLKEHLPEYI